MRFEFPDEDIMVLCKEEGPEDKEIWTHIFDGASNAMGYVVGLILIPPKNRFVPFTTRLCFNCTNNIANYEACTMGIEEAIGLRIKILKVYRDLVLLIH